MARLLFFSALLTCALLNSALCAGNARIVRVSATARKIAIHTTSPDNRSARLIELRPYETYDASKTYSAAWEGRLVKDAVQISRFVRKRDRLFSKWQLVDASTNEAIGSSRYADDLSALRTRRTQFPQPKSIKGLQSIVDLDDAIHLGVKHAAQNVMISQVLDLSPGRHRNTWTVDGQKIAINVGYIKHLDAKFRRLTKAGINTTIILLNGVPKKTDPSNPLIHPRTDLAGAPNGLGAFNLTDEQGLRHYRAALEFLANRYSLSSKKNGLVSGYIIGNELQAHWWWYNMGHAKPEEVIADYARAVRIAHLAVRKVHSKIRVYVSMDHHFTAAMNDDRMKCMPGKPLLDQFNAVVRTEGNFEWHLAWHPYPENLRNPRTWEDKQATLNFSTPKITFKNLEVLPAYLGRPEFQFAGKTRRIILSEQGFDTPAGPDGEKVQAAAYAYAYYKTRHIKGIDAFILHRHIDHQHEGGLKLGVRENQPGTVTTPGRKKYLYEVFRRADGPEWKSAFEFAKPIIGINDWKEVLPRKVEQ